VIGLGTMMAGFPQQAPLVIIPASIWLGIAKEKMIERYFGHSYKKWVILAVAVVLSILFMFTMETVILFGLGGVPEWMLRGLSGAP